MYDIPPIIWYLRKYHPKFISKIELGKGIPSVSYNLRHGGSVLIDRKNPRQSLPAIMKFADYIREKNRAAVIAIPHNIKTTGFVINAFVARIIKAIVAIIAIIKIIKFQSINF